MNLQDPKKLIFSKLSEISGVTVYQIRPEAIEVFPCITFSVNSNVPNYDLSKDITHQDDNIKVDIWGRTSSDTGILLSQVEEKMREINYLLSFNQDIADPSGISHITTQFTGTITSELSV